MSFMYKSMMSRAPGKRKIKLQEENILRLMQDEDDGDEEEDDDFQIDGIQSNEETDGSGTADSKSSTTDSEDTDTVSTKEPCSSEMNRSSSRRPSSTNRPSRDLVPPSVQSTAHHYNSKCYGASPVSETLGRLERQFKSIKSTVTKSLDLFTHMCCVCLKDKNKHEILSCHVCGISVHKGCYYGINAVQHAKTNWVCDSCASGRPKECELCPAVSGCLKETSTGQWCHIVCARYILGTEMFTDSDPATINFANLNTKLYGSKDCSLCKDRLVSKTGICVKCDAGLCKSFFHVTCAQKHGLLSENETDMNNETDPYFVYCPLHLSKEDIARSMKTYITAFALIKMKQKNFGQMSPRKKKQIEKTLTERAKRAPAFSPSLAPPPARSLSSNAAALRLLNHKAERMFGIDVRSPSVYYPRPTEVRKRHRVAPALTGEFASHYVDRELRIAEMTERLEQNSYENQQLIDAENELRKEYEHNKKAIEVSRRRREEILGKSQRLFDMLRSLKHWSDENVNLKGFTPLKLITRTERQKAAKATVSKSPSRRRSFHESPKAKTRKLSKSPQPEAALQSVSLLKSCAICHGDQDQHLMVDCDVCHKWIHLGCLEPPLTQMPKKTKFSLWQCSECAPSSDTSSAEDVTHGRQVTAEGRRVTRRSHRPPDKLSTSLLQDHQILEQRKMISYFSRAVRKAEHRKRRLLSQRLRALKKRNVDRKTPAKKAKLVGAVESKTGISEKETTTTPKGGSKTAASVPVVKRDVVNPQIKIANPKVIVKTLPGHSVGHTIAPKKPPEALFTVTAKPSTIRRNIPSQIKLSNRKPSKVSIGLSGPRTANTSQLMANADLLAALAKLIPKQPATPKAPTGANAAGNALSVDQQRTLVMNKPILVYRNQGLNVSGKVFSVKVASLVSNDHPVQISAVPTQPVPTPPVAIRPVVTQPVASVAESLEPSAESPSAEKKASSSPKRLPPPPPPPPKSPERSCEVCQTKHGPDKMMLCSACDHYFHIWCCDPPIPSMPRTNKYCKWECSNCTPDLDDHDGDVITGGLEETSDGRKKITRLRRPPDKFTNTVHFNNVLRLRSNARRPTSRKSSTPRRKRAASLRDASEKSSNVLAAPSADEKNDSSVRNTAPGDSDAASLTGLDESSQSAPVQSSTENEVEISDHETINFESLASAAERSVTTTASKDPAKEAKPPVTFTVSTVKTTSPIRPTTVMTSPRQVTVLLPTQLTTTSPKKESVSATNTQHSEKSLVDHSASDLHLSPAPISAPPPRHDISNTRKPHVQGATSTPVLHDQGTTSTPKPHDQGAAKNLKPNDKGSINTPKPHDQGATSCVPLLNPVRILSDVGSKPVPSVLIRTDSNCTIAVPGGSASIVTLPSADAPLPSTNRRGLSGATAGNSVSRSEAESRDSEQSAPDPTSTVVVPVPSLPAAETVTVPALAADVPTTEHGEREKS